MKTAEQWIKDKWGENWLRAEWQPGDVIDSLQQFATEQCKAYKELVEAQEELRRESLRLIGEIIDNYEADAINLPAGMYNELKFHWKQLKQLINDK